MRHLVLHVLGNLMWVEYSRHGHLNFSLLLLSYP